MKTKIITIALVLSCVKLFSQAVYTKTSEEFNQFHYLISSAERMQKNDSALQSYAKFTDAFESYKGGVNPTHYFR